MAKIDWNSIETDFLATGLSYSRLAEKHGVSLNSLKKRAAAEHWQAKLRELTDREASIAEPDAAETVEPEELALEIRQSRRVRLQDTADRMLDKIVRTLDAMDTDEPYALAALVRALRDLRELQGLRKDALDLAEQQARIERLRLESQRAAGGSGAEGEAGVLILPAIEETPGDGTED